jgi:hypothetical protein
MASIKRYLPFAAIAAVLLVASVGAVADPDESNPPGDGVPQVTEIEPEAREAMDVLDESRGAEDALPAQVAAPMDAQADFGMNPDLSRLSVGNATSSVYVVPADDHVCVTLTVGEGANLVCPPTADIASGRAAPATVVLTTGDIAVYGAIPDGVESVEVHTGTSTSTRVAAEGNVYYTVAPAGTRLRKVTYDGPEGVVEFPIFDPSAVARGT